MRADASQTGWGAHCTGLHVHRAWSPSESSPHQPTGATCSHQGLPSLRTPACGQRCTSNNRQYYGTLFTSTNRVACTPSPFFTSQSSSGNSATRHIFPLAVYIATHDNHVADSLSRKQTETHKWSLNPEVFRSLCDWWGTPTVDIFATEHNTECTQYCSRAGLGNQSLGVHDILGTAFSIPLPTHSAADKDTYQIDPGQIQRHSGSTILAQATVVHHTTFVGHRSPPLTEQARPTHTWQWPDLPPGSPIPASHSLEKTRSIEILQSSKEASTKTLYAYKWKAFQTFANAQGLQARPVTLPTLLRSLLLLFCRGLSHSSLRVFISAIVAHQPMSSPASLLFRHPTLKQFLCGLTNMRPPTPKTAPQWSLQLVLQQLTRPPAGHLQWLPSGSSH